VSTEEERPEPQRPVLRIVRGDPTPEELAALVTVLAARAAASAAAEPPAAPRSAWRDRSRYARTTLPHGPGAWRASALPR
jgi:Acyl-CoA carboxylase epsilon subunit